MTDFLDRKPGLTAVFAAVDSKNVDSFANAMQAYAAVVVPVAPDKEAGKDPMVPVLNYLKGQLKRAGENFPNGFDEFKHALMCFQTMDQYAPREVTQVVKAIKTQITAAWHEVTDDQKIKAKYPMEEYDYQRWAMAAKVVAEEPTTGPGFKK